MASVFKPKGKTRYVILYHDEQGRRRKKTGAADKTVTQRIARDIENRVALRREGVIDAKSDAYVTHEARPSGRSPGGLAPRHAGQGQDPTAMPTNSDCMPGSSPPSSGALAWRTSNRGGRPRRRNGARGSWPTRSGRPACPT